MRRQNRSSQPQRRTYWQRMTDSPTTWRSSPLAHLMGGLLLWGVSIMSLITGEIQSGRRYRSPNVTSYADEPVTFLFGITVFFVAGALMIWRGNHLWHQNGKR